MNPHGFAAVSCHLHTLDESGVINGANANFTAVPEIETAVDHRNRYRIDMKHAWSGSGNREPFERDILVMDDFVESQCFTFLHFRNLELS